jgi:hypothetical protein
MVNKAIFQRLGNGREDFQRTFKTRADKKVVIKQLLFAANRVVLIEAYF